MFKKLHTNDDASGYDDVLNSGASKPNASPSVLGPTLFFKGELSAEEDLVIEGQVEGAIRHNQQHLTIGQQGRIKGDIDAHVITVEGTVEGNLHGDDAVMIKNTAKVEGDICSRRIVIDDGAQFNGRIDMESGPQKLAVNLGGINDFREDTDSIIDVEPNLESSDDSGDIAELGASIRRKREKKKVD